MDINERKILGKKPSSDTGLGRWFREKWTAQSGEKCGSYTGEGRVKCRPSKRITSKSPQTWGEMSDEEKRKAIRLKQKAHKSGKQYSSHKSGKIWDGDNNKYEPSVKEMVTFFFDGILNRLDEKKKPYKGYDPDKNHPEGGLSVSYARKLGIHAGIETKREAQKAGGFSKLKGKTKKRQKSFCKRMCGMKAKNTSAKVAADPDSKINAALRVWGCRCA